MSLRKKKWDNTWEVPLQKTKGQDVCVCVWGGGGLYHFGKGEGGGIFIVEVLGITSVVKTRNTGWGNCWLWYVYSRRMSL